MPINVDNFFIKSIGSFTEISEIPLGFKKIFDSKNSEYFVDENNIKLIRISDHWGRKIKKCNWFLKGYPTAHCGSWKGLVDSKMRIGIIPFEELKIN